MTYLDLGVAGRRAKPSALADIATFSTRDVGRPLRPYQLEVARAVLSAVDLRSGLRVAVMIARQGGKNELSAHVEAYLLKTRASQGGFLVKAAPTFRPQLLVSKLRLVEVLSAARLDWRPEYGNVLALGNARCLFLSAEPTANVVGATAHHLLEFDEAQAISPEKHDRDFSPMGATTSCARVYWGTAWNDQTLLQRTIDDNAELERRDGVRRNFVYPWWHVADFVPDYGRYVEAERRRLGPDHPLFLTQYELKPIPGAGGLFSPAQRAQLRGDHPRRREPEHPLDDLPPREYVAAVDIAGEDEQAEDAVLRALKPRKDSTVLLIAEVDRRSALPAPSAGTSEDPSGHPAIGPVEPHLRVVECYWWTGVKHRDLYPRLVDLLRNVWRVRRVCVDASGIGAGVAAFLAAALGDRVCEQVVFTAQRKSALGYALLSAINGGRLKWWLSDSSPEDVEFWREVAAATYRISANQLIHWHVPETAGHDDFLVALALLVRAAASSSFPPPHSAVIPPRPLYDDGRY